MNRTGRVLASLLCLVLALGVAAPARAQDQDAPPRPEIRLVVADLSTIVGPGTLPAEPTPDATEAAQRVTARVLVENVGDVPVDDLRLSVEVFDAIGFRSTLRPALDQDQPRSRLRPLARTRFLPVRDGAVLEPGDIAGVTFASTAEELGITNPRSNGVVFPLRLSVLTGIDPLDQVTTSVIYLPTAVQQPLDTVVGWPLDDEPWRRTDGVYPADIDAPIRPGGRLDRAVSAAEAHTGLGLTFLPGPHLLEDLQDRADGFRQRTADGVESVPADAPAARRSAAFLERLRTLLQDARLDPVVGPYADVDVAGLVRAPAPLDDEAAAAVARGRLQVADETGRAPDAATFWASVGLDEASLDVLAGATATERVLLPFEQLDYDADLETYPADVPGPLVQLTTDTGRRVTGLVPDPYVARVLSEPDLAHGPVVAAQRVLAETAVLWTETPLTPRPLVLLPPKDFELEGRYGRALLGAIASAPWLQLRPPSGLDAFDVTREDAADLDGPAGSLALPLVDALLAARRELAAVQEAVPSDDGTIAGRSVAELELQLLRAPSVWLLDDGEGADLVQDVLQVVSEAYGKVVIPNGAQITLTSDSGEIPVTIQRPEGGPLEVIVRVGFEGAQLDFPAGQTKRVVLPGGGAQTYSFEVLARSTGSFGVPVTVTDPSGVRTLATGSITIRSTAISGPALAGTAVVIVLLLLVGVVRRRPDRPKLEVVTGS